MNNAHANKPRKTTHKVSKERLYRAVASSCAIEGNQTVEAIEQQLKSEQPRFKDLSLCF